MIMIMWNADMDHTGDAPTHVTLAEFIVAVKTEEKLSVTVCVFS